MAEGRASPGRSAARSKACLAFYFTDAQSFGLPSLEFYGYTA